MPTATVREVMERLLNTPPLPSAQQALVMRRANAAYEASPCSAVDRDHAIAQMILAHAPTLTNELDVEAPDDVDPSGHPIRVQLPKDLFPGVHALLRSRSRSQTPICGRVDASLNVRIVGSTADGARFEARRQPTRAFTATIDDDDGGRVLAIGSSIDTVLIPIKKGRSRTTTHTCGFAPPTKNIAATEFAYLAPSARKRALDVAMGNAAACTPPPPAPPLIAHDDRADAIRQDTFTFRDMFGDDDDDDDVADDADDTPIAVANETARLPAAVSIGAFPLPINPNPEARVHARLGAAIRRVAQQRGECASSSSSSSSS